MPCSTSKSRQIKIAAATCAAIALLVSPGPASAHAFGVRYDLPLPMWFYLGGAGAAVALSFVVMAAFVRETGRPPEERRFDLSQMPGIGLLAHSATVNIARAIMVGLLLLVVATGLLGSEDPFHNFAPVFVWVIWWVGLAFISALVGDLWSLTNPWRTLFDLADRAAGGSLSLNRRYPDWLSRWPAVIAFFLFAWGELISTAGENPQLLGWLVIWYSVYIWVGMTVFGPNVWLKNADAFTVVFSLIGRFAPTGGRDGRWWLRAPSVGLLDTRPVTLSTMVFTVFLLSTVTFDGVLETPAWKATLTWIAESQTLRASLIALQQSGIDLLVLIKTIALLVIPAGFLAVFLFFCSLTAVAGGRRDVLTVARWFILSIIPIAIAYHLSHYISYLMIAGQQIIPVASDPFGWGWDLFGSREYKIDISVVNARMVWFVAVTAIVAGHVFSLYVAHVTAFRVFATRRAALLSQLPMMLLMVGYTMVSLWILSQPIVA
ncbi:MAG: hypothetical protein HOL85_16385 [Rhodospirillaceae bacterium]|nr:hypothetical protein [Rhodospirillaceae bacterium]